MCGIAGFIGASKNPHITFQIATRLFDRLEERGHDASGFWGTEPGDDGNVVFHKEPISSSRMIQHDIWKKTVGKMNLDLMVMHARRASTGADPKKNKNNHPFTSSDRSIALVHNGKLPEHHDLRKKYEVRSDTDSEILLRIFEWASINISQEQATTELPSMDWITASKVLGLKKIFSYINTGMMACGVGERGQDNGERTLWLFRNDQRPIYVIDVRDRLGQIFFCSTDAIWRKAIQDVPQARQFIGRRWCIEMPSDEIWQFNTNVEVPVPDETSIRKIDIIRGQVWRSVEEIDSPFPIIGANSRPPFSVISYLNDEDDLNTEDTPKVAHKKRYQPPATSNKWYPIGGSDTEMACGDLVEIKEPGVTYLTEEESINKDIEYEEPEHEFNEFDQNFDLRAMEKFVSKIKQLASDISTTVMNKHMEGSMLATDFQSILEGLETSALDLEGMLRIAEQD